MRARSPAEGSGPGFAQADPLAAQTDCMRWELAAPEQPLSDGAVTLRVPAVEDEAAIDVHVRRAGGLDQGWLQLSTASPSNRGRWIVQDWLNGWARLSSHNGPALVLTVVGAPELVGMLGLGMLKPDVVEVVYGVAPEWRGRGLATRAARLVAEWLVCDRSVREVELRIGPGHVESQRVAAGAGFALVGAVQHVVERSGEICEDLRFVYASARST